MLTSFTHIGCAHLHTQSPLVIIPERQVPDMRYFHVDQHFAHSFINLSTFAYIVLHVFVWVLGFFLKLTLDGNSFCLIIELVRMWGRIFFFDLCLRLFWEIQWFKRTALFFCQMKTISFSQLNFKFLGRKSSFRKVPNYSEYSSTGILWQY